MPLYDRQCGSACGWQALDVWEAVDAPHGVCPACGADTARAWLTRASSVIGDECDFTTRNGEKTPVRFRSKIEHRRWMKERGLVIMDTHVGAPGSDKSKFTQRAALMDPQTLANATALVSRSGSKGWRDPDKSPLGITSDDGVIRYLRDVNRAENRGEFGFSDR